MFPRAQRLPRTALAARGKRVSSPHFSLAVPEHPGYAVIVSKAVAKSSVGRHLLKRRISAVLEKAVRPPGLIVYARAGAPSLPYAALKAELIELIGKVR